MSAAAVFPLTPAGRPVIFWSRSPQRRGHLRGRGLTRLDKEIERQFDKCLENGEYPSVPKLAYYAECTQRAVYNSLKRLKAAGAIEGESRPGLPSVYRMPFEYRGKTATPERAFTGTPERAFRGSPPIDIAVPRAPAETQENAEKERTTTPDPPQQPETDVVQAAEALIERGFTPADARILAVEFKRLGKTKNISVEEAREAFTAAAEYARHNTVDNLAGLYVAAVSKRWKAPRHAVRPRPTPAEVERIPRGEGESYEDYKARCVVTGEIPVDFDTWLWRDPPPHAVANI